MDNDISSDNIRSTVFYHYAQLFLIQKYNSKNDKETYNHNFKIKILLKENILNTLTRMKS